MHRHFQVACKLTTVDISTNQKQSLIVNQYRYSFYNVKKLETLWHTVPHTYTINCVSSNLSYGHCNTYIEEFSGSISNSSKYPQYTTNTTGYSMYTRFNTIIITTLLLNYNTIIKLLQWLLITIMLVRWVAFVYRI